MKTYYIKIVKNQRQRNLKVAKERKKQRVVIYKGTAIRLSADFSVKTLQAKRE